MPKEADPNSPQVLQDKLKRTNAALEKFDGIVKSRGQTLFSPKVFRAEQLPDSQTGLRLMDEVHQSRGRVVGAISVNGGLKDRMEQRRIQLEVSLGLTFKRRPSVILEQRPEPLTEGYVRGLVSQLNFYPTDKRIIDTILAEFQTGVERFSLAERAFTDGTETEAGTQTEKALAEAKNKKVLVGRLGVFLHRTNGTLRPHGVTIVRKDKKGIKPTMYVFRWIEPLNLTNTDSGPKSSAEPVTAETDIHNPQVSEIQESPPIVLSETHALTPELIEQTLDGVQFNAAENRVVTALKETIDEGLETNILAGKTYPSSSSLPSNRRSSFRALVNRMNEKTRPRGLEIIGEEKEEKQYFYRWQIYNPRPLPESDHHAVDDWLWSIDESSEDSFPPIHIPRETEINLSPESQIFADQVGRNIAHIVTSEILREKESSDKITIGSLPSDILELNSAEIRDEIDNALPGLTKEEKRRVLIKSTTSAIERAWAMSEARDLGSKEDLATVLNCHGLERRGHNPWEIIARVSEQFPTQVLPVEEPATTS